MFFGAFYGLMEFIPYIGPIIGPVPAVLVALFDDPISAVWVDPPVRRRCSSSRATSWRRRCSGISLRINPILIILALLIGYQLYGIAGALVALPIAVIRQTVVYLRRHLVLEPWGTRPVAVLGLLSDRPESIVPGLRRVRGRRRRLLPGLRRIARAARATRADAAMTTSLPHRSPPRPTVAVRGVTKRFGARAALQRRQLRAGARASWSAIIGPNGAGQDDAALDPRRRAAARRGRAHAGRPATSAGCRSSRRSTPSCRWPRTCGCSRAWRSVADPEAAVRRDARPDRPRRPRRRGGGQALGRQPAAGQHRHRAARREPPVLLLDEPSASLDPRQRERLWEFIGGSPARGTTVVFSTHNVARGGALRRPRAGPGRRRAAVHRHPGRARAGGRRRAARISRRRSCASCTSAGTP